MCLCFVLVRLHMMQNALLLVSVFFFSVLKIKVFWDAKMHAFTKIKTIIYIVDSSALKQCAELC